MSDEMNSAVTVEHLLGSELAAAAGETLADARLRAFGPALAVQLATARGLLATYWELRRRRSGSLVMRDSAVAAVAQRLSCAEARFMSGEGDRAAPAEQLLGSELAAAAEEVLAAAVRDAFDPVPALQVATTQLLLALYWELRHQHPEVPVASDSADLDVSLEWVSALLCSR